MPSCMWPRTWQCMCHSPSPPAAGARSDPMKEPWLTVKAKELAGPNVLVSSNWETAVTCGLP